MADRLSSPSPAGVSVRVTGVVQGVGFRPFVHHLAGELGLSGHVGNDSQGVFIEASGPRAAIEVFLRRLVDDAPALAVIDDVSVVPAGSRDDSEPGSPRFRIVASPPGAATGAATSIPPDTAVCDDCLAEMRDPDDRRFGYPFIACTSCGPRFTIVTGLPYDRPGTTMADFPLCPDCLAEYEDPSSRRFHAQPTACPDCGPHLSRPPAEVVAALRTGAIVAIKGIGGYHLACDARDASAVGRLRTRKQRGDKPFAVMVPDLAGARALAHLSADEEALLASPARPIVLADSRDAALQDLVAPGNTFIGVMLAYAPLHHLLFDSGAPPVLVMTSGNLADEPICIDPAEAEDRLAGLADLFCHHDRSIHVACDDSVVRMVAGSPQPVRRSRGYAPMPVALPLDAPPLVAVGGEIKATAAVASGRRAWLSQHVGDTENLETLDMLGRSLATLVALQQVTPRAVVSDAHPGYLSHAWAARHAGSLGVDHLEVQHHHAHLASLLAEHRVEPGEPVLGVVFDGTGYGADATIWGGELLLGSYASVRRIGHLRPILLPGGDAAIRVPARTAVAHLAAAGIDPAGTAPARALGATGLGLVARMLATGTHCVPTTSAGRLFDAVAALLDVRQAVDYEAQAAIELEALAARARGRGPAVRSRAAGGTPGGAPDGPGGVPGRAAGKQVGAADRGGAPGGASRGPDAPEGPWGAAGDNRADHPIVLDPRPWIARAVADHAAGLPVQQSALAFHLALADAVAEAARSARAASGVTLVGLTGGVFANAVLTEACLDRLAGDGFTVLTHRQVPPNDGGLALGQVAVAAAGGARRAGR
jgi:hydrogenase maturation protein HypF